LRCLSKPNVILSNARILFFTVRKNVTNVAQEKLKIT
jgi:hypothetical protein